MKKVLFLVAAAMLHSYASAGASQYWGFDVNQFFLLAGQNLQDAKGYALIVHSGDDSSEKYAGIAASARNHGGTASPWNSEHFTLIGSVSKTITSIAVMRTLEDHPNYNLDSPIESLLPARWHPNAFFRKITLRQLMTHKAGLTHGWPRGYGDLRRVVEEWAPPQFDDPGAWLKMAGDVCDNAAIGDRCYSNLGFTLLQTAFGYLAFPELMAKFELQQQSASIEEYDEALRQYQVKLYESYVLNNIFGKVFFHPEQVANCYGATNPAVAEHKVWLYSNQYDEYGYSPKDALDCAVGGWLVKPQAFVETYHAFFDGDSILTQASKDLMLKHEDPDDVIGFGAYEDGTSLVYNHRGSMGAPDSSPYPPTPPNNLGIKNKPDSNQLHSVYLRYEKEDLDFFVVANSKTKIDLFTAIGQARNASYSWKNSKAEPYCFFEPTLEDSFHISRVKLANHEQLSGWSEGSYADYTDQASIPLKLNQNYDLEVTADLGENTDFVWEYSVIAWIDYYHQNHFLSVGKILDSDLSQPLVGETKFKVKFEVPKWAKLGETRLRVQVMNFNPNNVPWTCLPNNGGAQNFLAGEVEDYTVDIAP